MAILDVSTTAARVFRGWTLGSDVEAKRGFVENPARLNGVAAKALLLLVCLMQSKIVCFAPRILGSPVNQAPMVAVLEHTLTASVVQRHITSQSHAVPSGRLGPE